MENESMTEGSNPALTNELFLRAKELGLEIVALRMFSPNIFSYYDQSEQKREVKLATARIADCIQGVRNDLVSMALRCNPDKEVLGKSIQELQLPKRGQGLERKLGIRVCGELTAFTALELLGAVKNFGEVTVIALQEKLAEIGLKLREE